MRRREMMTGALGLGAGLIAASPATPAAAADPAAALERALFDGPSAAPAPLPRLAAALGAARADYEATRYQALAAALPGLIATAEATRDAAAGRAREQAHTLLARAYVLATELGVKQRSEATWVAADRALSAARAGGDPQPIGEAARVLAITMRRAGRTQAAVSLLSRTAASLDADRGTPSPQALAARACLLMTGAYTAAAARQRTTALDLLAEAEETTRRIPQHAARTGLFVINASLDECAMYRISTFTALGTPDDALPYAARIVPARLPTTERQARYLTDTARMWNHIGDPARTYAALRALERLAPEEARRPSLRLVTTDLLYSPHHLPGLRDFATRTGALPG
ncbi:transcriptional regulator [Streptomyces sp. DSM 44917]|uniref:Transcriptional regulator n=1 Tax=Streptomyces boetiae TaxID=3075541 RepID=A0ABU2LG07_9ACTN|nr:transcriptional regulator [Streptomyces sp. DSM 44917]MDT0310519.1 transcriptional regulator [Streptomyces sp. DSM 44917]